MQGFELRLQHKFDHTNSTQNQNDFTQFVQSMDIESVFQTPEESWVTYPTTISNFSTQATKNVRDAVFYSETVPTDSSVLEETFSTDSSDNISELLTVPNNLNSFTFEEEEYTEVTTMQSELLPSPGKIRIMGYSGDQNTEFPKS